MRFSTLPFLFVAFLLSCGGKADTPPGFVHSNGEIRREFKKSPGDFRSKYNGKEVAVWGTVEVVDLTGDVGLVRFKETEVDLSGTPTIRCEVEKANFSEFTDKKVAAGMQIRIKGTLDLTPSTMDLKHCRLEKTGAAAVSD